jgi:6-phosphofructokinase 1
MASDALLVFQSGGPTAVVNASLAGVIAEARARGVARVLGARHGVEGLLAADLVELSWLRPAALRRLSRTPAAALGSGRYRPSDSELERVLAALRRHAVRWLCAIGGNDTAETAHRIARAAQQAGLPLSVIGVPKTIDNDLPETDHSPGYGSVARFVAQTTRDAGLDTAAMARTDPVKFVEVQGRSAGWIAAAAALGRERPGDAPHLIYFPERPVAVEQVLEEVRAALAEYGRAVVVLSENQTEPGGRVLGSSGAPTYRDAFGHGYSESPAAYLARLIARELGVRARFERPGTIARSSTAHVSPVDRAEAELVGRTAVRLALDGQTDRFVVLVRAPGPGYRCTTGDVPLEVVAGRQRLLPDAFIAPTGRDVTAAFLDYARPLIGPRLPALYRGA